MWSIQLLSGFNIMVTKTHAGVGFFVRHRWGRLLLPCSRFLQQSKVSWNVMTSLHRYQNVLSVRLHLCGEKLARFRLRKPLNVILKVGVEESHSATRVFRFFRYIHQWYKLLWSSLSRRYVRMSPMKNPWKAHTCHLYTVQGTMMCFYLENS